PDRTHGRALPPAPEKAAHTRSGLTETQRACRGPPARSADAFPRKRFVNANRSANTSAETRGRPRAPPHGRQPTALLLRLGILRRIRRQQHLDARPRRSLIADQPARQTANEAEVVEQAVDEAD